MAWVARLLHHASNHHNFKTVDKDVKAKESIHVITLLENLPQPCKWIFCGACFMQLTNLVKDFLWRLFHATDCLKFLQGCNLYVDNMKLYFYICQENMGLNRERLFGNCWISSIACVKSSMVLFCVYVASILCLMLNLSQDEASILKKMFCTILGVIFWKKHTCCIFQSYWKAIIWLLMVWICHYEFCHCCGRMWQSSKVEYKVR